MTRKPIILEGGDVIPERKRRTEEKKRRNEKRADTADVLVNKEFVDKPVGSQFIEGSSKSADNRRSSRLKKRRYAEGEASHNRLEYDKKSNSSPVTFVPGENGEGDKKRKKHTKKHGEMTSEVGAAVVEGFAEVKEEEGTSFVDFGLDERLIKAVAELGWKRPTQVQQSMIPLALEGKNILARARTGSGKSAAFMLPTIQKLLQISGVSSEPGVTGPFVVVIAPTKELASQLYVLLTQLLSSLPFLQSMNYGEMDPKNEDVWLKENPDIIISTPSILLRAAEKKPQLCSQLHILILDEADLLLSYGYEEDMKKLSSFLPEKYQAIFTSATLTDDVGPLKEMYMKGSAVALKLKEGVLPEDDRLSHYHIICENEEQKFAILLSMLKLGLIVGKSIIFVSSTDRCYKLGLFLNCFGVRNCILNSEMPANSRSHAVQEFNEGKFKHIIASDINDAYTGTSKDERQRTIAKHRARNREIDKESGVSRGIDFHNVSNVINFDFPSSCDIYIHRVGRTARGWNTGVALSFVVSKEKNTFETVRKELSSYDGGPAIHPYEIRMKDLDSFLLRAREALTACTRVAIREARFAEIRQEALKSKKLEGFFAENPREKSALESYAKVHTVSLHNPAISDVPDYMVPKVLRSSQITKLSTTRKQRKPRHRFLTHNQFKHKRKEADPLQTFKA